MYFNEFRDELSEKPLTAAQRLKRARAFRKSAPRRKAAIKRARFKKATPEKLKQRARKLAILTVKKSLSKGKAPALLSNVEKMALEKRVEKKAGLVNRLARKLLKVVRAKERAKLSKKSVSEASKLPPHLAKFFDKKGDLKPEVKKRLGKGQLTITSTITDRTPKGFGPGGK